MSVSWISNVILVNNNCSKLTTKFEHFDWTDWTSPWSHESSQFNSHADVEVNFFVNSWCLMSVNDFLFSTSTH